MRAESLEQLEQQNAEHASATNSGRAVQNAYSFFWRWVNNNLAPGYHPVSPADWILPFWKVILNSVLFTFNV